MGLFSKILQKLGIGKEKDEKAAAVAPAAPAVVKPQPAAPAKPAANAMPVKPAASVPAAKPKPAPQMDDEEDVRERTPAKPAPVAISEVDVVKKLEELSKGKGLDWKVSIVDLLKLLELDSSFAARKELATELGCPAEFMGDSAKMNTWLHKEVLKQIAANGGNIPKELLG